MIKSNFLEINLSTQESQKLKSNMLDDLEFSISNNKEKCKEPMEVLSNFINCQLKENHSQSNKEK
ncbi:MAG: hypothetical protein OEY49_12190 [Candidatus Heimdallarchaeota archaeon]|nr:hypothetical protein [Candidatus Heimdallarchaeota archaeon]